MTKNTNLIARALAAACWTSGLVGAFPVRAESTGAQTLTAIGAMDVFRITCPAGSRGLRADVADLPAISHPVRPIVTILKNNSVSTSDSAEGLPSSGFVILDEGPGQYHVVYRIMGSPSIATDDYMSVVNCRSTSGFPTASTPGSFAMIVNQ